MLAVQRGATTRPLCANYYLIRLAVTSSHAPTAPSDHPFYSHRASPVQVPQTPPLHSTTRPSLLTISPAHLVPSSIFAHRASGPPPRHGCLLGHRLRELRASLRARVHRQLAVQEEEPEEGRDDEPGLGTRREAREPRRHPVREVDQRRGQRDAERGSLDAGGRCLLDAFVPVDVVYPVRRGHRRPCTRRGVSTAVGDCDSDESLPSASQEGL